MNRGDERYGRNWGNRREAGWSDDRRSQRDEWGQREGEGRYGSQGNGEYGEGRYGQYGEAQYGGGQGDRQRGRWDDRGGRRAGGRDEWGGGQRGGGYGPNAGYGGNYGGYGREGRSGGYRGNGGDRPESVGLGGGGGGGGGYGGGRQQSGGYGGRGDYGDRGYGGMGRGRAERGYGGAGGYGGGDQATGGYPGSQYGESGFSEGSASRYRREAAAQSSDEWYDEDRQGSVGSSGYGGYGGSSRYGGSSGYGRSGYGGAGAGGRFGNGRGDTRTQGYFGSPSGDGGGYRSGSNPGLGNTGGRSGSWLHGESERSRQSSEQRSTRSHDPLGARYGGEGPYEQAAWSSQTGQRRAGPKGYTRSDERIREDLCERLSRSGRLDVREVEVEVDRGIVTLTGSVPTRQQKYLLEDLADDVFGVQDVHNQVRVHREWGGGGASDTLDSSGKRSDSIGDTSRTTASSAMGSSTGMTGATSTTTSGSAPGMAGSASGTRPGSTTGTSSPTTGATSGGYTGTKT